MKQIIFLIILILPIILSCNREEGCTSVDALNFNVEAKEDDGSCAFLYLGLLGVYLDSTSSLIQEPDFNFNDHKFILKFSSNRYNGPAQFNLEFHSLNSTFNYNFVPLEDIIVTNEEWRIDLYFDDTSKLIASFTENIFEGIANNPSSIGWGTINADYYLIIGIRE